MTNNRQLAAGIIIHERKNKTLNLFPVAKIQILAYNQI
jgi:hypothetical protein